MVSGTLHVFLHFIGHCERYGINWKKILRNTKTKQNQPTKQQTTNNIIDIPSVTLIFAGIPTMNECMDKLINFDTPLFCVN